LSQQAWINEFEKYKMIPEYQLVNKGMSLEAFKVIYWWEWGHRFFGRLLGFVLLAPALVWWWRRQLPFWLGKRVILLGVLGMMQATMGWIMVASGLTERVDVAPVKLSLHLSQAALIVMVITWTWMDLKETNTPPKPLVERVTPSLWPWLITCLIVVQIFLGGLVAGNDAGFVYNTWPLMDGHIIPPSSELFQLSPWMRNTTENHLFVQFIHRMGAYTLLLVAVVAWWRLKNIPTQSTGAALTASMVALQSVLGIVTLVMVVPLSLGLAHQVMGMLVLITSVMWLHRTRSSHLKAASLKT
jgi:cytochrome c oxidase assembly protein subunit 15